MFESFCPSAAYSLITDYFPPCNRTTANACFAGCIFVGGSLSSLSAVLIGAVGWRLTYDIVAGYGIVAGLLVLFLVKEPKRGRFDPAKSTVDTPVDDPIEETGSDLDSGETTTTKSESKITKLVSGLLALVKNPCTRWLMIGGSLRFWQTTAISFYCIKYFDYYERTQEYGVLNAIVILAGGLTSSLTAGWISDKYEDVNYKTKSYICSLLSVLALPMFALVFLFHFNFYFSMAMLFLENLLCEGWMAPCIAMIQTVIDVKHKAVSVGVFFFATAIAQTLSAVVVG